MRFNSLNEVFCHTADEVTKLIENRGYCEHDCIHVSLITLPDDEGRAEATVSNHSEPVFYIEADTEDDLRAIVVAAGLNVTMKALEGV
jgi:hypothetical protein